MTPEETFQSWIEQSIVMDKDELYLFGDKTQIDAMLELAISIYNNEESTLNLGYSEPIKEIFTIQGVSFECIMLWYDNEEPSL